jgi:LruC domain-containing protein
MTKKTISITFSLLLGIIVLLSGCEKNNSVSTVTYKDITSLTVSDSFSYRTTSLVSVSANLDSSYKNKTMRIYASAYETYQEDPEIEDVLVGEVTTDSDGMFEVSLTVPLTFSYLVLKPGYIGLVDEIRTQIKNGSATFSYESVSSKSISAKSISSEYPPTRTIVTYLKEGFYYLDTYTTSTGVPTNLTNISLSDQFLDDVNASLPEYSPVPDNNPEYLEDGKEATLELEENADVWVTFVGEGASYKNTLGFYTYATEDGVPSEVESTDITIIFPNASLGTNYLSAGDTVYIGNFEPGVSIGWVLIANGWSTSSQYVKYNYGVYYSDSVLNPEAETSKRQHTVVLYDEDREILVTGIEDLNRTYGGDNDFNDLIFYAIVNPVEAVSNLENFSEITHAIDTDGDGVFDEDDAAPNDPSITTSETVTGTVAYEDRWPSLGDYDFNDLVVEYSYDIYGNADNKIAKIDMSFTVMASGAGYRNGLGLALPIDKNNLKDIDDPDFPVTTSTDSGVNILVFEDAKKVVNTTQMFNTQEGVATIDPVTVTFSLVFVSPVDRDTLGTVPYDLYALVDNSSSSNKEVHFADYAPTSEMGEGWLGTEADSSNASEDRYYKTENNLPWAIQLPSEWSHPLENVSITEAYTKFGAWAESSGTVYTDWYLDISDYQDSDKLFSF